ncbi:MAG: biotin--[acetyl-CoA-carboxylase] ligase [Elusimicrobia bacterium HGW-Elusimicrobia-1]|jgi:BirA family biotin operon repressor/biotin-[acetyl-CoA-carboxylase] ligase|nr:MAG: biotin--[acetyl-CoA-carboxylase] ligase [Elusimicrobia bacterium HGW-Elusimicrobia-1]
MPDSVRKKIFRELKKGALVSGEALAGAIGVSRADVNKHIKKLREMGCDIHAARKSGYIMKSGPDKITFDNLELALSDDIPGLCFVNLTKTDSTQTRVKALAEKGSAEWLVVRAGEQTAAYGRLRRRWESSPGGLWFSVLLRPNMAPSAAPAFSPAFSLAVRAAVERASGVKCYVKWPNDVLAKNRSGEFVKIAGIITEISADSQKIHWLAVGCGLNVSNKVPSGALFAASSLLEAGAPPSVEPARILAGILAAAKDVYDRYSRGGFAQFVREYDTYNALGGRAVAAETFDGETEGAVKGVDNEGRLILETSSGLKTITAGDVTIKKA